MIRQAEREQLNRLTIKTLNQVFIMRAKEASERPPSFSKPPTGLRLGSRGLIAEFSG